MSKEWKTRKKGTPRQKGSKFPIDPFGLEGSHRTPPPATFHRRPKETVFERADRIGAERRALYEKRRKELIAKAQKKKTIKELMVMVRSRDEVESAIAKAELQRRYPAEYPHLMESLREEETERRAEVEGKSFRERMETKVERAEPVFTVIERPAKKEVAKEAKERKERMEKGEEADIEVVEAKEEDEED